MNPWYLAAILAGGVGLASLASSAAAQAQAAIPRVTSYATVILPIPGLNGQWDLQVTGLNAKTGNAMLAMIPGSQMIYIPAATVQAQPLTKDFTYTFTPRGATTQYTIIVPMAVLQAWAKEPKTAMRKAVQSAFVSSRATTQGIQMVTNFTPANACTVSVTDVVSRAQGIINGFPADGSDASAYATWGITTAGQVPSIISDINTAVACIQNGSAAGDIGMLTGLIGQLAPLVAKALSNAGNPSPSPSPDPTPSPDPSPSPE